MAGIQIFEQVTHSRHLALSVVDGLAKALHVAGEFPPPLGEITCEIVEVTAPVARTVDPPLQLSIFRNASGYLILDGTYADPLARMRRWPLGPGTYRVRVRGDYYEETEFTLPWPPADGQSRVPIDAQQRPVNVDLRPSPSYPLPDVTVGRLQLGPTILRGSLFTSAGDPIAGVRVEVIGLQILKPPELPPLTPNPWPFFSATSSERGDWAIVLPGRRYLTPDNEVPQDSKAPPITKQITVRIHYPKPPVSDVQTLVELGTEHSIRNTALRGQVLGRGGRPVSGVRITTSVSTATSVSRGDGVWFLYFDLNQPDVPNVTVTVTTPDGATASDSSVRLKQGATIVVPAFHFS